MRVGNFNFVPIQGEAHYEKGMEPAEDSTAYKIDNLFIVKYLDDTNEHLKKLDLHKKRDFVYGAFNIALGFITLYLGINFGTTPLSPFAGICFFLSGISTVLEAASSPSRLLVQDFLTARAATRRAASESFFNLNQSRCFSYLHPTEIRAYYLHYLKNLPLNLKTFDQPTALYILYSGILDPSFLHFLDLEDAARRRFNDEVILPLEELKMEVAPAKNVPPEEALNIGLKIIALRDVALGILSTAEEKRAVLSELGE